MPHLGITLNQYIYIYTWYMFGIMITIPILVAVIFTPTSNPFEYLHGFLILQAWKRIVNKACLGLRESSGGRPWDSTSSWWWEDLWETWEKPSGKMTKCSIDGKAIQILVMIIQLLSPYWLGKWCYQSRYKACVWLITLPMSCPRREVQQRLRPNLQICQWLCRYL